MIKNNILKINTKRNQGYTIIETMISVSLFLVIVTSGMSALVNANVLHRKSQDMRSIIDNLSFILEDMSRNLRTGYNYQCFSSGQSLTPATLGVARDCADGWAVAFESSTGDKDTYNDQWSYYFSGDDENSFGRIYKSIDGANTYTRLTPEEVDIDQISGFVVKGAPDSTTDTLQPIINIRIVGTINYRNISSPFSLQTSVSQRVLDF
ncbi:MAG: hypothetical protein KBD55_01905 [Candidatus Pacebacteria bacterium]|nr:hypothetical protein [Candidatus Paceibacterota bacterium]